MTAPDRARRRAWLGAVGAILLTTPLQGRTVEPNPVKISLAVTVRGPHDVAADVTFANVSLRDLWILKEPPGFYLSLDGREVDFIGPMAKRRAPTLDDYERLAPGRSTQRHAQIAEDFAFVAGTHLYELRTAGGYYDPVSKANFEAPAVREKFTLTR